ncbi:ABC transporter permease [Methanogenium marinum]|uniref:ABC transporter permease n=1 Tax=Methanogenium marinum TaxID=348610 RepID=A0A9Q4PVK9_9EURY|nr:ABC transporter permease [Methanogenium marinum]MDE4907674.1 ABC transporter permease [Methanogenium marinum]
MIFDDVTAVWNQFNLTERTIEHLWMFSIALTISVILGIILGIILYQHKKYAEPALNGLNALETFPDMALLVLLIPVAGIGEVPTIIACIIYSLLPVTRNTYTGLVSVRPEILEAGTAIGLTEADIVRNIRIPVSLPMIAGGIRIAIVFTMGIVTLGGIIGAGGLGAPLQTGIVLLLPDVIIVTGLWVGILAVIFDGCAGMIEKRLTVRYGEW